MQCYKHKYSQCIIYIIILEKDVFDKQEYLQISW